jgi:hypothetical protein
VSAPAPTPDPLQLDTETTAECPPGTAVCLAIASVARVRPGGVLPVRLTWRLRRASLEGGPPETSPTRWDGTFTPMVALRLRATGASCPEVSVDQPANFFPMPLPLAPGSESPGRRAYDERFVDRHALWIPPDYLDAPAASATEPCRSAALTVVLYDGEARRELGAWAGPAVEVAP